MMTITQSKIGVLILVLVEDGLGVFFFCPLARAGHCLNPCFSGGWSRSVKIKNHNKFYTLGLNPCFSGGWSRSVLGMTSTEQHGMVLILVLVEDGLGALGRQICLP